MLRNTLFRPAALLAAVGTLLCSSAALAAAPALFPDQPQELRFLLQLPPGQSCGAAVLTDSDGLPTFFPVGEDSAVLSASPGTYTLSCGSRTASLALDANGSVTVLSGAASWDGEQLTLGCFGTLELHCMASRDQPYVLTIETAAETITRPVGYDPQLDSGCGCEIVHLLTLPAGEVTVSCCRGTRCVELRPGETLRLEF